MAKSSGKKTEKVVKAKSDLNISYAPTSSKAQARFNAPRMTKVQKNMRAAAKIHSLRPTNTLPTNLVDQVYNHIKQG